MSSAKERRAQIVDWVNKEGWASVSELVKHFGVSEPSIRRDLERLESQDLLRRIHGGALPCCSAEQSDLYGRRAAEHPEEKRRIAQAAVKLICPNASILLDSGSTVAEVAKQIASELPQNHNLHVVTNSMPAAQALAHRPDIELLVVGGLYAHKYRTMVGPQAVAALQGLHMDTIFLGAGGLSFDGGLTAEGMQEIEGLHILSMDADKVIVVADSSKIGRRGMAVVMPLEDINILVTDSAAPPEFVEKLESLGVKVILV